MVDFCSWEFHPQIKNNLVDSQWYKPSKLLPRIVMNATDYIPQLKKGLSCCLSSFSVYETVTLSCFRRNPGNNTFITNTHCFMILMRFAKKLQLLFPLPFIKDM